MPFPEEKEDIVGSKKIISCFLCFALICSLLAPIGTQAADMIVSEGAFDIKIPDAVAELIRFYFSGESRIEVPAQVQGYPVVAVGEEVFRNLDGITQIILPEGVESIGDRAFYACIDLVEITLPTTLQAIGEMAFSNCYALESLLIPANVQTIGMSAFMNCSKLTAFQVDETNPWFKAENNVLFTADMTQLLVYLNTNPSATYTVPQQVRRIGEKAFMECGNLQQINLPAELMEIEKYAFSGCDALVAVTIPDSVEKIGTFAFNNCTNLQTLVLGAKLEEIPAYAFNGCESLTQITIPNSLETLAADAFRGAEIANVRFYSTAQKEQFAQNFPQSQILCLCKAEHAYLATDPINCTDCDYVLDWHTPPQVQTVTHNSVQLVTTLYFEYSYDLQIWQTDGLFTNLQPNQTYQFYARIQGDHDKISQSVSVTTDRAPQPKAPTPVLQSRDSTSVTLQAVDGCEYSMDGITWQASPKLTGLRINTAYVFYQRYAQTQTHYAGPVSEGATIKTAGVEAVTSTTYTVKDSVISKIPTGTTVQTLLGGLHGGECCIVLKNGAQQSATAIVGTGMTLQLKADGAVIKTYQLMVTGDTNGDGEVSITDMLAVKAHILNKTPLSGVNAQAADTNGDGGISVTDFIQIKAKILGKGAITAR